VKITPSTVRPAAVVSLRGEIDLASVGQVERLLSEAGRHDGGPVVVDMTGVTFLDCRGLSVLLSAQSQLADAGTVMLLAGVPPAVERLMRLVGVHMPRFPGGLSSVSEQHRSGNRRAVGVVADRDVLGKLAGDP
jgi:anti-anti-sigma factor